MRRSAAAVAATGFALAFLPSVLPAQAGSAWDAQPVRPSAHSGYAFRDPGPVGTTVEGPLVDGAVVPQGGGRASYGFGYDDWGRPSIVVTREPVTRLDPDATGWEPVLEGDPDYLPRSFEYVPARRLVLPGSLADGAVLPANVFLRPYADGYGPEGAVTIDTRSRTVVRISD